MTTVQFDLAQIRTEEEFYNTFFAAVEAPAWHGRNPDALIDSIGTGGINGIDVPYSFELINTHAASPKMEEFFKTLITIVWAVKRQGYTIEFHLI